MLARDDVDAVGVFTPDNLHHEHAVAALEAGKHVFVEKPMAIKTEDCDRMIAAWKRSGKRFMVGMNMRYLDTFLTLKQIMDSGQLGTVKAIWVRHFVGFGGWAYFHDYRANRKGSTGLLLQKASHDFDMIHFLTGRYAKRVCAMGALDYFGGEKPNTLTCGECPEKKTCPDFSTREMKTLCCFRKEVDVEDHSMVLMDLGDVRACYLQCHYATETNRNYLVIGTRGEAELTGNTITVKTQKANTTKARAESSFAGATYNVGASEGGHGGADPRICKAFLDLVLLGQQAVATPEAGRMSVAVGCAATESLRNGNIPIDLGGIPG
jgi:predicted dehydrogenase